MIVNEVLEESYCLQVREETWTWLLANVECHRYPSGSLSQCDEYCQADNTLLVDDATWLSDTSPATDSSTDQPNQASQSRQKKRKRAPKTTRTTQKKLKISKNGAIDVDNEREAADDETPNQANSDERFSVKKNNRAAHELDENDETLNQSRESLTFVDLSNVCLFDDETPSADISSLYRRSTSDSARAHNRNPSRAQTQVKIITR